MRWSGDFLGVAYRYFDLRMNVVPLFGNRRAAQKLWQDVVHWWPDASIRIRFVEEPDSYWFVMGAESRRPDSNVSFYRRLPRSPHYERFKAGYGDAAYMRFGEYSTKTLYQVKDSDLCNCQHPAGDHADDPVDGPGENDTGCLEEGCECDRFVSTQVYLLKRKKTVADIAFLNEADVRDDPLAWNCMRANAHV